MKTDVIFLGAGASTCAGFPTNEELTRYIIEDLCAKKRPSVVEKVLREGNILNEWKEVGISLRKAKSLSIDEYCQIASTTKQDHGITLKMKRILRVALRDYMKEWDKWNDYGRLIYSLFKQSTHELDDRFTIVNFNYDGLFGKLLKDAAIERRIIRGISKPNDGELAALGGGYYRNTDDQTVIATKIPNESFAHHMPHGTITAYRIDNKITALDDLFYPSFPVGRYRTQEEWEERFFEKMPNSFDPSIYMSQPMIHFPWEEHKCEEVHNHMYDHAANSILKAERIHFIGLSGHNLLRPSLTRLFAEIGDKINEKQFFVATKESNKQRVLDRLIDCALTEPWKSDFQVRENIRKNLHPFDSFFHWLNISPHSA